MLTCNLHILYLIAWEDSMALSFSDIFFSNFKKKTYCYLDEPLKEWIEAFDQKQHHPEITEQITRLFCESEISKILESPIAYDEDTIQENVRILEKKGFRCLSRRQNRHHTSVPHYSAFEHPSLDGWVIKPCGKRVPDSTFVFGPTNQFMEMAFFSDDDSLYRIPMRQRIQKIARSENIPVILPQKYYVKIPFSNEEDPKKSYFIIAKKIDILGADESIRAIKEMSSSQQSTLAFQICRLIQSTGFLDASMANIRLTRDGNLAIIDTEPAGFLRQSGSAPILPWMRYGHHGTLEKSGRIGLHRLRNEFTAGSRARQLGVKFDDALPGLEAFKEMCDEMILKDESLKPTLLSKTISVFSLGLFPLIWAIQSFVKSILLNWLYNKHELIQQKHQERSIYYSHLNYSIQKEKEKKYRQKTNLILRLIHMLQDGVPRLTTKSKESSKYQRLVEC